MSHTVKCASDSDLRRLLHGQLDKPAAKALESHILECDACSGSLDDLLASDPVLQSFLQTQATVPPESQSAFVRSISDRLKTIQTHDSDDDQTLPPSAFASSESGSFSFLQPPQSDGEIGRLGSYRILKVLGSGGMGTVFLAEDINLQRKVALKVMKAGKEDEQQRKRFLREARAMAKVSDDNIVTVFQVGEERDTPFLAMEFLDGKPLDRLLDQVGKLKVSQAVRLGRQIALGLAAAHKNGLIHRDIKPGNIWIESKHGGRVKILDFGLVRPVEGNVRLTQSGAVMGTPAFMAPEQVNGEEVDPRCDLFSLGCVLYQMLTGQLPFQGPTMMTVMIAVMEKEPAPIGDLNTDVPDELAELVKGLLAKSRDDRLETASVVAQKLSVIEKKLTHPMPAADQTAKVTRPLAQEKKPATECTKNRFRPVAMVLGVVVLLAGLGIAGYLLSQIPFSAGIPPEKGTLVIEADDPNVEVIVSQNGAVVVDKSSKRMLELRVGNYEIELAERKDGLRLSTKKFAIERGGKAIVKVTFEPPRTTFPPLDAGWVKKVHTMAAEEQAKAVGEELKKRNPGFDGKIQIKKGGVRIANATVTVNSEHLQDLTPFRALPWLRKLICRGNFANKLRDLSPLRGLPLTDLTIAGNSSFEDLSPLKEMPLRYLNLIGTSVQSLAPLEGMQLQFLRVSGTKVNDLRRLKGMPLGNLHIDKTEVHDLTPLDGMHLRQITLDMKKYEGIEFLRSMKSLERINEKPAAEFWKEYDTRFKAFPALNPDWVKKVKAMNPKEQVTAFERELQKRNSPDAPFPVRIFPQIEAEHVKGLNIDVGKLNDLTPVRVFSSLRELNLSGIENPRAVMSLSDLSPLQGMKLQVFELRLTNIADLKPLRGMPLNRLSLSSCPVTDLSPVNGMPLVYLHCHNCKIRDLSPLRGMKLNVLNMVLSNVTDLSPIEGMPISNLNIDQSPVEDLKPLRDMPLIRFQFEFKKYRNIEAVRAISTLKTINNMPGKEFWKKYDAKFR